MSAETTLPLLADPRRRQVIDRLSDTDGVTTVDRIEQQRQAVDSTSPGGNESKQTGIERHHVHVPKLQEADVIEYDSSRGVVRRGRQFQGVRALLEVVDGHREVPSTTRA
jgi:hypothetical protein